MLAAARNGDFWKGIATKTYSFFLFRLPMNLRSFARVRDDTICMLYVMNTYVSTLSSSFRFITIGKIESKPVS